ncbi:hypothetical protein A2Z41_00385 [Microgenomates group bacterium RBG_19FT_COMBO_39_10]|nr:MAG: hypothetical protein A2Z41_00385 [Microgenomates group bacterium RBG_19FT_COMBO_39_10]
MPDPPDENDEVKRKREKISHGLFDFGLLLSGASLLWIGANICNIKDKSLVMTFVMIMTIIFDWAWGLLFTIITLRVWWKDFTDPKRLS